jgi:membrane-associated phospholipid phosphatase
VKQIRAFPHSQNLLSRAVCGIPLAAFIACFCLVSAHTQPPAPTPADSPPALPDAPAPATAGPPAACHGGAVTLACLPRNFLCDQAAIWTSPARLRPRDIGWLAPLALASSAAIATDHRAMTQVVSQDPGFNNANVTASNVLIGVWIAAPVALYGYGHFQQDDHAREAGLLGGESMLDGVVVELALKQVFRRERPSVDDARGRFFQSNVGFDSSFPSSHAVVAWSAAAALAAEYRSPWTQIGLYSAATSVSFTRVLGREHFPSDVLAGSSVGWLIGHYVVKKHRKSRELGARSRE